ncbi:MAG: 30S ribosomal protein S15 [Candidatus Gracilibacteria bacterium]|jgi:small subunit ribosomal protein S15
MKPEIKKKVIKKHAVHEKDTGSPQVQVAILTTRITELSGHLKSHPKDNHSRSGLIKMVGKRRKLLTYLKTRSKEAYDKLVDALALRK